MKEGVAVFIPSVRMELVTDRRASLGPLQWKLKKHELARS